jgi:hypothetical protein
MGRATSASQPPREPACLKPGKVDYGLSRRDVVPADEELLADAHAGVLTESSGLNRQERDAARRGREPGPADAGPGARYQPRHPWLHGPAYEIFAGELAAYGYPVILSWCGAGRYGSTAQTASRAEPN